VSTGSDHPERLTSAALARGLGTRLVGRDLRVFDLVVSTNDVAWELAAQGVEEGTVVLAEGQTAGRGRLGRNWWSPRGAGLWLSVLLRPPARKGGVPMTTIIGALATADAIRTETRLPAKIRWPNDVLVEGRKVAGVLVEARGRELVLGIGIDVNVAAADVPGEFAAVATSLSEATGGPVDRLGLARRLLRELDRWYRVKLDGDTGAINDRWRELSAVLGEHLALDERGRRYQGTVIDVDVRFGIALRLDTGGIRHFRGEHVSLAL